MNASTAPCILGLTLSACLLAGASVAGDVAHELTVDEAAMSADFVNPVAVGIHGKLS